MRVIVAVAVAGALVALWAVATTGPGLFSGAVVPAPTSTLPERLAPGAVTDAAGPSTEPPDDAFRIAVDHVIDGDTIKARPVDRSDLMPDDAVVSVRLIGIDTPETYPDVECWGPEATDTLRALAPAGSTLWAAPDVEWFDRYDRVLLYLWTADGTFVNRELVAGGDAETLVVQPNDAYAALFADDESSARAAGLGLWGACS